MRHEVEDVVVNFGDEDDNDDDGSVRDPCIINKSKQTLRLTIRATVVGSIFTV